MKVKFLFLDAIYESLRRYASEEFRNSRKVGSASD